MPDPQPWAQAILSDADAVKAGQGLPPAYTPPQQPAQPRLADPQDPSYLDTLRRFWAGAAPSLPSVGDAMDAASRVGHAVSSAYQHVPSVARDYISGLTQRDPTTQATVDAFKQQTSLPRTGNPVLDSMAALPTLPLHLATDQAADMTTPGWAALAAVPALGVGGELADAAKTLFPKLDAYSKPAGYLSRATMLKRIEGAADLAPETKAALTQLAEQVGERRVAPAELHALAAGETYTPDRVVRKVRPIPEGEKQIPGAPLGVSNARQVRGLRERYLGGIEQGVAGRDWYHDTGESILSHANDDPERARLVAGDIAITSPATSVSANTGMGVKAYNQLNANVDLPPGVAPVEVNAGRFPTAMGKRMEELHAGGEETLGLKRDPFAQNMALGGGFHESQLSPGVDLLTPRPELPPVHDVHQQPPSTRAVHDIWDAELHGYVNPDGTPMRTGFGPAQHRFMDRQQDKIVATANQRALGGHTNWDDLRSQAAGWTGAKINAGDIDPKDAALSPADLFPEHYAQGSREFTPGASTGHMPELLEDTPEARELRQLYHDINMQHSGIYDAKMRDQITAGQGGLVGPSFEGPGYFKGRTSPGVQTQVLTGSEESGLPGERVLDEGSRRLMDASEATHALVNFQDAFAWNRLLPAGSGGARTGWEVTLPGGTITPEQLDTLMGRLHPKTDLIPVPTPGGVRLAYRGAEPTGQTAFKFFQEVGPDVKQAVKAIGGKLHDASAFRGGYGENPWDEARVGQQFFDPIRQMGTERFDASIPQIAANRRVIDQAFAKGVRGRVTLNPLMDRIQGVIANEGWSGLERLAKQYGIPVTALVAALGGLQGLGVSAPSAPSVQREQ